jgi:hypothetical protein
VREHINLNTQELDMPRKIFSPEQIIAMLRQIDVLAGQGKLGGLAIGETMAVTSYKVKNWPRVLEENSRFQRRMT